MFESSLERDLFTLLDFDIGVSGFEEQPIRISYVDKHGRQHTYTPDVLIHYHANISSVTPPPLLAEVKFRADLFKDWEELKPKFKAARAYSRERGWQRFRILTENEIRTPYLENAKFLRGYIGLGFVPHEAHLLLDTLAALGPATPQSLLLKCSKDPMRGAELMPTMWHLVALRYIGCDLNVRLTMESPIWPLNLTSVD
jgi:hypothetical protein